MRENNRRAALIAIFLLAGTGGTALGEMAASGDVKPDPNLREVMLVRQDQSDCSNSNVSGNDPSLERGIALVNRGSDGITRVKIAMTVSPNTTYHFFLKCVRILGDIKTGDEGEGFGSFEFPTNSVGNVYAFDMYPEGAPAGNKFQSVQVKF
jgi:hypothetical protein